MKEGQPLLDLGIMPDSIWGDDEETVVYAQVLGNDRANIFRFSIERDRASRPQSPSLRIVACYHDLDIPDDSATFQDRSAMRSAVWSSIADVWPSCSKEPAALDPSVVFDLNFDLDGNVTWTAYREPLFDAYLDLLHHVQPTDLVDAEDSAPPIVDLSQVMPLRVLGDRGCCKLVRFSSPTSNSPESSLFVFKGMDFQTYLQWHGDNDDITRALVETWRGSSKMIAGMPPHPNIQPPPKMLVSISNPNKKHDATIVGHLSTFHANGDLLTRIATMNENTPHLPQGHQNQQYPPGR